jgi:hypothetical protein
MNNKPCSQARLFSGNLGTFVFTDILLIYLFLLLMFLMKVSSLQKLETEAGLTNITPLLPQIRGSSTSDLETRRKIKAVFKNRDSLSQCLSVSMDALSNQHNQTPLRSAAAPTPVNL